jgi:hypothetical protein
VGHPKEVKPLVKFKYRERRFEMSRQLPASEISGEERPLIICHSINISLSLLWPFDGTSPFCICSVSTIDEDEGPSSSRIGSPFIAAEAAVRRRHVPIFVGSVPAPEKKGF